jgi:S-ribosylhomocysteine lyase LuxS involved in autoinducer biosynthesis
VMSGQSVPDLTRYNCGQSVEYMVRVARSMARVVLAQKGARRVN